MSSLDDFKIILYVLIICILPITFFKILKDFSLPSPGPTTIFHRYCIFEDKQYSCTKFWSFHFYWAVHDNLTLKYHGVSEFERAFKELCKINPSIKWPQLIQRRKKSNCKHNFLTVGSSPYFFLNFMFDSFILKEIQAYSQHYSWNEIKLHRGFCGIK